MLTRWISQLALSKESVRPFRCVGEIDDNSVQCCIPDTTNKWCHGTGLRDTEGSW